MKTHIFSIPLLYIFVFIVAIIAVFYPVFTHQFLYYWDDQWMVMNSMTEGGLAWNNITSIFGKFYGGQYAPVVHSYFAAIYSFFGYNATAFHTGSLLLHIANTFLLFVVLKRLLTANNRFDERTSDWLSFGAVLLFAIHPMNVEAIAWISAVKIPLYIFFFLTGTLFYQNYIQKKNYVFFALSVLAFILSCLSKEQAVACPFWLLFIDWAMGRNLKKWRIWVEKVPFFIVAFAYGCVTMYAQSNGAFFIPQKETYPFWQRIVFGAYSYVEYVTKTLFPFKLLYLYPFPVPMGYQLPTWLLFYPLLLVVVAIIGKEYLKKWYVIFTILFFTIPLITALHVISIPRFAIVADRYVYLSSAGITFLLIYLFFCGLKKWPKYKTMLWAGAICYTLYLGIYSNIRIRAWYDTETLKTEIKELLKQRNDVESFFNDKDIPAEGGGITFDNKIKSDTIQGEK